ncbi:MAG: TatD family hydrolase [Dissulfurimicrobium sp.]|uniref:TatD family hydrolase n=1 Tax=Dissulfurimicrobium sp. TaxID=2022436 RepID=UPI00404AD6FE
MIDKAKSSDFLGWLDPLAIDLIDTHVHLDIQPLASDPHGAVSRAREQGVAQMITIGVDLKSSERAVALAGQFPGVFAAVGIHPHDADSASGDALVRLEGLASMPKVVAIGEIGLDFAKEYAPRAVQRDAFIRQLDLALKLSMPVIIHDRDAHNETLDILENYKKQGLRGVIHCFSGDAAVARRVLGLGFFISVTGVITFPKTDALKEAVISVPLDRLMVETDCPYLSPAPFRGRPNEPARVIHVAREVARLKDITLQEAARRTSANARVLFKLPAPAYS